MQARAAYDLELVLEIWGVLGVHREASVLTMQELAKVAMLAANIHRGYGQIGSACVLLDDFIGRLEAVEGVDPGVLAELQVVRLLAEAGREGLSGSSVLVGRAAEELPRDLTHSDPLHRLVEVAQANDVFRRGDGIAAARAQNRVLIELKRDAAVDHLAVAEVTRHLVRSLLLLGSYDIARRLLCEALTDALAVLPADSIMIHKIRIDIAGLYMQLKERDPNAPKVTEALPILREQLEADSLVVLRAEMIAAAESFNASDPTEAVAQLDAVVRRLSAMFPADHPSLIAAIESLHSFLLLVFDRRRSDDVAAKLYRDGLKRLGPAHPRLIPARRGVCRKALDEGDVDAAIALLRANMTVLGTDLVRRAQELPPSETGAAAHAEFNEISWILSLAEHLAMKRQAPGLVSEVFAFLDCVRSADLHASRRLRERTRRPNSPVTMSDIRGAVRSVSQASRRDDTAALLSGVLHERELHARLGEVHPIGPLAPSQSVGATVSELQARLATDEALIYYWRYDRWVRDEMFTNSWLPAPSFAAFVIRRDAVERVNIGPYFAVKESIDNWRSVVDEQAREGTEIDTVDKRGRLKKPGTLKRIQSTSSRIRHLVLDPLKKHLKGARTWYVCPDEILHQVPLDGLYCDEHPGKLIGETVSVRLLHAASDLLIDPTPSSQDGLVLLVGDVDYDSLPAGTPVRALGIANSGMFPRIKTSRDEIDQIRGMFASAAGAQAVVFDGARVTLEAVQSGASAARFIHISSHATSNFQRLANAVPMRIAPAIPQVAALSKSILTLSGANIVNYADGMVSAAEVASWSLQNCQLAVLSACESNVGQLVSGVGVASFQRGLRMAGARGSVTSLWKIHGRPTKDLMEGFYRELLKDLPVSGASAQQALWRAKMGMRDAATPYADWVGWAYSGSPY